MTTISLADLRARIAEAKRRIAWVDDEASTEALRNKGAHRTVAKRALLARAEERARKAGRKPIKAYY